MRTKFATIFDSIGIGALVMIVVYAWVNFVSKNFALALVASICAFVLSLVVCFWVYKTKQKKFNLTKQNQQNIDDIYKRLQFCPTNSQTLWLKQSIFPDSKTICSNFFVKDGQCIYNAMLKQNFAPDDLTFAIRDIQSTTSLSHIKTITILAESVLASTKSFAKSLNIQIEILDKVEAIKKYNLVSSTLPENIKIVKQQKNYRYFLSYALSPARFKSYFLLGLILITSSFFVMFKLYYLIFGSLLIVMSIITLCLKLKNKNAH